MKKSILVLSLLFITISFGQTKKKVSNKKTEIAKKEALTNEAEKKITTSLTSYDDAELVIEGTPNSPQIEDENTIYNMAGIEIQPEFPGGREAMNKFILSRYTFPDLENDEDSIKGKVFVSFVVEKDGNITDIKIIRDFGYGSGDQILKILKTMPKWKPGQQNGKNIRCYYMLPITISNGN